MLKDETRAGQLNAVIDPKLLFMAKLAARYKDQTLIEFIEGAFRRALTREAMRENEPRSGHDRVEPKKQEPLMFEDLWDDDEVARLYRVATSPAGLKLLAPRQRDIFNCVANEVIKQNKKVTRKNFVESFDTSERDR